MILVVTGVAGAGKTTVGTALAERLEIPFLEGDDEHPIENVALMAQGLPLTEEHREPWLDALSERLAAVSAVSDAVLACSALRREHRARLADAARDVRFIHLDVPPDTLRVRLALRTGHFFGPEGLDAQLETLEPPGSEALVLDGTRSIDELVDAIAQAVEVGG